MARHSAALLCVLYHAAPALAFVAPGALAPGRPALQVPASARARTQPIARLTLGCVRALCSAHRHRQQRRETRCSAVAGSPMNGPVCAVVRAARRVLPPRCNAVQTRCLPPARSGAESPVSPSPLPRALHRLIAGDDLPDGPRAGTERGGARAEARPPQRACVHAHGGRGGSPRKGGQVRPDLLLVSLPDCFGVWGVFRL